MQVESTRKLFTVEEYYRMAEVGILTPDDRVELIDGEIIQMSPIGVRHAGCVSGAIRAFVAAFGDRVVVSPQHPLQLTDYTEPEPDIVLLQPRKDAYRGKKMKAEDAILVVEVADTTLDYDRDAKVPRYCQVGIPEVWIEDLAGDRLFVYRKPSPEGYQAQIVLNRGDSVSVEAFPDVRFSIDELLG